jgi:high affinity sulfate transporter 1
VATLRNYRRSWLRGDIAAGITVTAYLVPQVMAYATVAGLPPIVGLWTMVPVLAVYAVFGSSRVMSVGPESTTALMSAATVAPLAAGDPIRYAALSAALATMVGLLALVAWAARVGFIADLLSRPVLLGYMAGVAVLMAVGQLSKLTGVEVDGKGFVAEFTSFLSGVEEVDPETLALAGAVLLFMFAVSWRWPRLPTPLLAVLLATAAVTAFNLESFGIEVAGEFSRQPPDPVLPTMADLTLLILPAVGVLLVGYTDVVLTARAFAARTQDSVDSNQELFALGASNLAAGAIGGFTISSSGSRTALALAAGAKTQVYSLTALVTVLTVIFLLGPLLAKFPAAALGAIVVYAATKLIDVAGFRKLWTFRKSEFVLAIAALVSVLWLGILIGVALAVALSVADMLRRVARPHDAVVGFVPGLAGMHDVDDYPAAQTVPGLVVYRYDSPLFFANSEDFQEKALGAVSEWQESGPVYWFLLNMEANVEVDITAMYALEALHTELTARGIEMALTRVKHDLWVPLERFGIVDDIGAERIYPTLPVAVAGYRQWLADEGLGDEPP